MRSLKVLSGLHIEKVVTGTITCDAFQKKTIFFGINKLCFPSTRKRNHGWVLINRFLSTKENLYRFTATPRFENKSWGVYVPVTFDSHAKVNAGLALRWKPFIIGSANLLTRYLYCENEFAGDFYDYQGSYFKITELQKTLASPSN